jgi:GxxExxY protein
MNTDQQTGQMKVTTPMSADQQNGQTNGARARTGVVKLGGTTEKIIGVFYDVYNELGHGFLESVYEGSMVIALREAGLRVVQQQPIAVFFRGQLVGDFRADLIVDDEVIVEVKAARAIEPAHEAQLMNYLRASRIEVGLLMNFGPKAEFKRFIFDNDRKDHR